MSLKGQLMCAIDEKLGKEQGSANYVVNSGSQSEPCVSHVNENVNADDDNEFDDDFVYFDSHVCSNQSFAA